MDILEKIVIHKQKEISLEKKTQFEKYKQSAQTSPRKFADNLRGKNNISLIAEIKRASPSRGPISPAKDTVNIVQLYRKYADCISVLTDTEFFSGSFGDLRFVRSQTQLPILCKDFIIDEYQIYKARYYGADAILLIASILNLPTMEKLFAVAQSLNMDVIFETHTAEEINTVLKIPGIKIIGINNRNLKNFSIDLTNTITLAKLIPEHIIVIAESGINSSKEKNQFHTIADACLVGTSIMKAKGTDNRHTIVKDLSRLPEIKICGITNTTDYLNTITSGATYIGYIFAPSSPRAIRIEDVREFSQLHPNLDPYVQTVGVFVNQDIHTILEIAPYIHIIQLHGNEDDQYIDTLRSSLPKNKKIWKSYNVDKNFDFTQCTKKSDKLLFDAKGEHPGGNGITFNWELIPPEFREENILAGGITPENIREASTICPIIDVSSGVEIEPGKKCKTKLEQLFLRLRNTPEND